MANAAKGLFRSSMQLFWLSSLCWLMPAMAVPVSIPPLMTAAEMLTQFNQRLLLSKNAQQSLDRWCHQQLDDNGSLRVEVDAIRQRTPPAEIFQRLQLTPNSKLSYLKQRLIYDGKVVAVFDHWFREDLLTPEMQQALQHEPKALGDIARDAGFFRQSLSNTPLWPEAGTLPVFVLEHTAIIYRSDSTPFSLVQEHYTNQLLPRAQQLDPY